MIYDLKNTYFDKADYFSKVSRPSIKSNLLDLLPDKICYNFIKI